MEFLIGFIFGIFLGSCIIVITYLIAEHQLNKKFRK